MKFDNNFDDNIPNLVDKRIINYYKNMIKKNQLIENIKKEEIIILKDNTNIAKWYQCYLEFIKKIIYNYYGFILLFIIIFILLYLRYKEVDKKKKYIKKFLKKYI